MQTKRCKTKGSDHPCSAAQEEVCSHLHSTVAQLLVGKTSQTGQCSPDSAAGCV